VAGELRTRNKTSAGAFSRPRRGDLDIRHRLPDLSVWRRRCFGQHLPLVAGFSRPGPDLSGWMESNPSRSALSRMNPSRGRSFPKPWHPLEDALIHLSLARALCGESKSSRARALIGLETRYSRIVTPRHGNTDSRRLWTPSVTPTVQCRVARQARPPTLQTKITGVQERKLPCNRPCNRMG
jgi:hypothetical protein